MDQHKRVLCPPDQVRNMLLEAPVLCDDLLDNPKLHENPTLFALALSAAAQHTIHATLNVHAYCEKARTSWGRTYRWGNWKLLLKWPRNVETMGTEWSLQKATATEKCNRQWEEAGR